MFPARLVHHFLQQFTRPGDRVLDPFSGRGTTLLQSRVENRNALGGDLNPLAFVLTRAKAAPPTWSRFISHVASLERAYNTSRPSTERVAEDIRMLFSPSTLKQILYLRAVLASRPWSRWSDNDFMLAGCVAGILHGAARLDGSSAYLSISMPNTFSMSPAYVRTYIEANGLQPPEHNVFDRIKDKAARLYQDNVPGRRGTVYLRDATTLLQDREAIPSGSIDLLLTSPPYLKVVNYGIANWIRLWWLGIDDVGRQQGEGRLALDARLDHKHTVDGYHAFMLRVFRGTRRVLRRDGVAAFVIGDVAQPDRAPVQLGPSLWKAVGHETGLQLIDVIEDRIQTQSKVSRIWGDTKGKATECDRILLLARSDGKPRIPRQQIEWYEEYRDAGADGAHRRLNEGRRSDRR